MTAHPSLAAEAPAVPPRPWKRAAAWLLLLAPFFYLTYGVANWLASLRAGVPSIVFEWERSIPFLPWTILPYWSINLLYGLSLFVCRSRRELDAHARRLLTAQVVATLCFLALPLRFSFERPEVSGLPGLFFGALAGFDRPFNQAPSLHIALLVILWALYGRHLSGAWRWLLHGWFALIGASVLTTYQHHAFDVPTGAALGFFCLWLWPLVGRSPLARPALTREARHRVLAGRYLAGALALGAAGGVLGGAGLWLFWPALSLLLVALAYALVGAPAFAKGFDGRMSLPALALFAPYLIGAWINSRLWTRPAPEPVPVADGVWLSRFPSPDTARRFAAVIDCSTELPRLFAHPDWRAIPMLDLVPAAPEAQARAALAVETAREKGPVLVCCALGLSRSANVLARWLVATGRAGDIAAALAAIRTRRPGIVIAGGDAPFTAAAAGSP